MLIIINNGATIAKTATLLPVIVFRLRELNFGEWNMIIKFDSNYINLFAAVIMFFICTQNL